MTTEELDKLSRLPIKGTDPAELVDLSTVSITLRPNGSTVISHRLKTPICFG
jgi:hypothetical protein